MSEPIRIETVDALDYRVGDHDWAFARDAAARIDAHWATLIADKPQLFNGRVLLQNEGRIETQPDGRRVFRGHAFACDFKAFLAWRDFGAPDRTVGNVFAMAALRCADGAFLLGEMGSHTSNAGRIYFPAGTPDLGDVSGDRLDLEGSACREVEEETGLVRADLGMAEGWTVVFEEPRTAFMKLMDIAAPAQQVKAEIEARLVAEANPELARMHVVRSPADFDPARMPGFILAYLAHMLGG